MSKVIATAAIRGAHQIVERAEKAVKEALEKLGPEKEIAFPNTAYFLPIIYGMTGFEVKNVGDMGTVIKMVKDLLPPVPSGKIYTPYLGEALDAGMATYWAEELIEALKYLEDPIPYVIGEEIEDSRIWLGAADDLIMRKRGVEFVDGTAPGFAACVGACPDNETAAKIAKELQQKNLYVFLSSQTNGQRMSEQLVEAGVQVGWPTRLVPFGPDITATIFSIGFATRAAMSFGGAKGGDYRRILKYNKDRIFAFVLALGEVDDEKYANAAGAINWGFPTIADTDIPEVLPTGICTYEHVVSMVPHDQMVSRAIEVRGLKVTVTEVPIPVAYGPAFEGERVRKEELYVEMGGTKTPAFEWTTLKEMDEVEDGKIEVIGPDLDDIEPGSRLPLAITVEVAGRNMQKDFEPILERNLHNFINQAEGVLHIGQREIIWLRISKKAKDAGFRIRNYGDIIHALYHQEFGSILDKVQVKIYTEEDKVKELMEKAKAVYTERDERIGGLVDEEVDTFYSCTLCQSFAPSHVCVVSPERSGLCGAYSWLDCKAAFEINPTGPNQPVKKGELIEELKGQWVGINQFVFQASRQKLERFSMYSILEDPMTACGCFEVVTAILPLCNGVMVVNREYKDVTPCGMSFSTLAGSIGGGLQTPGFFGNSRLFIVSKKYVQAEGGFKRLIWMPKELKEAMKEELQKRAEDVGVPDMIDKIADETVANTEEEVLEHLQKVGHPALEMEPLM